MDSLFIILFNLLMTLLTLLAWGYFIFTCARWLFL